MNPFRKIQALLLLTFVSATAFSQERVLVGAFDPTHAGGLVFITNNQNLFGLRFLLYRQGATVETAVRHLYFGPYAVSGAYSQIAWRTQFDEKTPVTLRWSRMGKNVIVGRLSAPAEVRVAMEVYRPWETTEAWGAFSVQQDRRAIFGEQVQATAPGLRRILIRTDRTGIGAANYNSAETMREMLVKEGHVQQTATAQPDNHALGRLAGLSFDFSQNQSLGFVAVVGDDFDAMDREAQKLAQKNLAELLDQAEKNHENVRAFSSGALGDTLETIARALNWNRYYWPEKNLELIAAHRQSHGIQEGEASQEGARGVAIGWNTFLSGAMAAMVDAGAASATMHALLEGQTLDGRVPLRRYPLSPPRGDTATTTGRSMPPIGALCVWRVYMATNDLELLAWAYPRLKQWNDWWFADRGDGRPWRDGNSDGLLEHGYDAEAEQGALGARTLSNEAKRRYAFSESGLEDRPQWNGLEAAPATDGNGAGKPQPTDLVRFNDRARTLEFSTVGLNALYALDTEMMGMIARELGLSAEAGQWQLRYDKIRTAINTRLWSEENKLYLNRHWDGRLSHRISLENFFPLLAGIPDEERAKQMLDVLRDPKRFGLLHPLPAIARDDPAFDGRGAGRGAIWAPMNYLLYLGLKRYGFHDEAGELARRSNALARAAVAKSGRLHDAFSSLDDGAIEEDKNGLECSFAGLMLWPAVEELISSDPWAGLTLGSTSTTEEARIERIPFAGAVFDVIAGSKRTVVRRGDRIEVECEGPVRLRAYRTSDRAIGFAIETKDQVRLLVPAVEGRKVTVSVDDKVLGSTSAGAAASFKVPAGTHKVLIVK
jgi:hypothetical protein